MSFLEDPQIGLCSRFPGRRTKLGSVLNCCPWHQGSHPPCPASPVLPALPHHCHPLQSSQALHRNTGVSLLIVSVKTNQVSAFIAEFSIFSQVFFLILITTGDRTRVGKVLLTTNTGKPRFFYWTPNDNFRRRDSQRALWPHRCGIHLEYRWPKILSWYQIKHSRRFSLNFAHPCQPRILTQMVFNSFCRKETFAAEFESSTCTQLTCKASSAQIFTPLRTRQEAEKTQGVIHYQTQ